MRSPSGDQRVGSGARCASAAAALSRSALSVLTRRSSGARVASAAPSCGALLAEHAGEMRIEPFRIVAGDMRRRAGERRRREPRALRVASAAPARSARRRRAAQWRRRRARARAPACRAATARGVSAPITKAARRTPAQRVVDEARDGGAVAGAGEAVRQAPVLERVGRRPVPRRRCRRGPRSRQRGARRASCAGPSRMRTAKMIHMRASTIAPARNSMPRRGTSLSVTWMKACSTRNATNTQASSDEQQVGLAGGDREQR